MVTYTPEQLAVLPPQRGPTPKEVEKFNLTPERAEEVVKEMRELTMEQLKGQSGDRASRNVDVMGMYCANNSAGPLVADTWISHS